MADGARRGDRGSTGELEAEVQRLQSEVDRLSRESQFLHTLMEAVPDHIYFKDRDSRFLRISRAMSDWFTLDKPDDAVGRTDADFFTEEHAAQARRDEEQIMETGEPLVGVEEKETWPTGGETWVSTTKVPVRDADGAIVGTCGISRDITKHRRVELERERLLGELQEAMSRIHTLHGLIPICTVCKRIRDDKGYWHQVECYISENSDATFSHSLCKECAAKLYPGAGPDTQDSAAE